jgi:hypothetical protein
MTRYITLSEMLEMLMKSKVTFWLLPDVVKQLLLIGLRD